MKKASAFFARQVRVVGSSCYVQSRCRVFTKCPPPSPASVAEVVTVFKSTALSSIMVGIKAGCIMQAVVSGREAIKARRFIDKQSGLKDLIPRSCQRVDFIV